jgi:hypothetical protein
MDLSRARILVVNDDGINAPGLKVLERIARALAKDVWVFAPETEQSGTSHAFTLTGAIRLQRLGRRRFAVSGSPTDCVLLAVSEFLKDRRPDIVLSGVNRGGNLAEDVIYSGTVAGAMEAALLGIRAVRRGGHPRADRPGLDARRLHERQFPGLRGGGRAGHDHSETGAAQRGLRDSPYAAPARARVLHDRRIPARRGHAARRLRLQGGRAQRGRGDTVACRSHPSRIVNDYSLRFC